MLARRLLALAAGLLLVGAIASVLTPPDLRRNSRAGDTATVAEPTQREAGSDATAGGTEAEPGPGSAPVESSGSTVRVTVRADPRRPPRTQVALGDLVDLSVVVTAPTTVSVQGVDRFEAADATSPARFEFFARRAGTFEIRLADGSRAGQLVVSGG